jgi:hypothetical protein
MVTHILPTTSLSRIAQSDERPQCQRIIMLKTSQNMKTNQTPHNARHLEATLRDWITRYIAARNRKRRAQQRLMVRLIQKNRGRTKHRRVAPHRRGVR